MGGNNLLAVLISTIKSRFSAITSKIRLWTSWNFIRSRVIIRIRDFFVSLLDVRPKNPGDYFSVFGWLVSRKLAYTLIILTGVVSIWYITAVNRVFSGSGENGGIRTYKYSAVPLRFADSRVRILGKSGYLAYEGDVAKGYAAGEGSLFNPEGDLVYRGHFEKSKYEQNGTLYYPSESILYEGTFHENLYDGEGRLYREDGSLLYEGAFSRGKKNGEGTLYDAGGNAMYQGPFSNDSVVYASFLGKSAAEAGQLYSGPRRVWQGDSLFCVEMSGIGAVYAGISDAEALDDSVRVEEIYVLSDLFPLSGQETGSLKEVEKSLGTPVYEGNSAATLPEAVVINLLNERKPALSGEVPLESESLYSDVTSVTGYNGDYSIYLTTFESGDLLYTFYSGGKNDSFAFYGIRGSGG